MVGINVEKYCRSWWIIGFTLSFWLCGSSIQNIREKWQSNPVTMSISEIDASVSAIPFPTVTICPETKTIIEKLDLASLNMLATLDNLTEIE